MSDIVKFISNAGGSIVSKNILNHKGNLKWCVREESINKVDNGWRFFSDLQRPSSSMREPGRKV